MKKFLRLINITSFLVYFPVMIVTITTLITHRSVGWFFFAINILLAHTFLITLKAYKELKNNG